MNLDEFEVSIIRRVYKTYLSIKIHLIKTYQNYHNATKVQFLPAIQFIIKKKGKFNKIIQFFFLYIPFPVHFPTFSQQPNIDYNLKFHRERGRGLSTCGILY